MYHTLQAHSLSYRAWTVRKAKAEYHTQLLYEYIIIMNIPQMICTNYAHDMHKICTACGPVQLINIILV